MALKGRSTCWKITLGSQLQMSYSPHLVFHRNENSICLTKSENFVLQNARYEKLHDNNITTLTTSLRFLFYAQILTTVTRRPRRKDKGGCRSLLYVFLYAISTITLAWIFTNNNKTTVPLQHTISFPFNYAMRE